MNDHQMERLKQIKEIVDKWKTELGIDDVIVFKIGSPFKGRHPRTQLLVEPHTLILIIDPRASLEQINIGVARELVYYLIHYCPNDLVGLAFAKYPTLLPKIQKTEETKETLERKLENEIISFISQEEGR